MSKYANRFTMDAVRLFWDGVAVEYGEENERVERMHTQRFREALRRLALRPGMKVLNVWSRTGSAVPYLRGACADAVVVNAELSRGMLDQAARFHPNESFIQTSLHELPFGASIFDAVLSLETLEHVPDPLLFLAEIRRVLVPGGDLVMSLPPSAAEWTSFLNSLLKFHHGEGPHRFLAPGVVKRMLGEAGFELLEHRGTLFVPFSGTFFESLDTRLSALFTDGPFAQLGIRQFYVCKAPR
ncbi:MAG: methyltransferase domain-containing protein [Candidatus Krumholzibacteria bacterium]|nr:methyltransferase domain-containing protein [Candidatus Krumholzibacteria bacterium]